MTQLDSTPNHNTQDSSQYKFRTLEEIQQDLPPLVKVCQDMVQAFQEEAQEHRVSDDSVHDWKQYIYEAAVSCVLGEEYWDWLNRMRGIHR